jgi:WD40 repeat protein
VESYLFKPVLMPAHKPILTVCPCDPHNVRIFTGYNDGSLCLWDTVRKQPLNYFMT